MINIRADTSPYLEARNELLSLLARRDEPVRGHIAKLLNGVPQSFLMNFVSRATTDATEVTIIAEPSNSLGRLIEALRADHIDLDVIDGLFHEKPRGFIPWPS